MSLAITAVATAAVFTGYTIYQGERANALQQKAAADAKAAATKQADLADQANNKANGKRPDVGAMLAGNAQTAMQGGGSTMLTGPAGVSPTSLSLGKNTLLGS
jgi:uncharacterized protein (UPF0333 family)